VNRPDAALKALKDASSNRFHVALTPRSEAVVPLF
jgi:hypothetical protein